MAKDFSKCWYPDSGQDILEVVDDTDIFICLKDKFGNTIHNKNLASFTRYDKETGEKTKYVLLRPIESYGEDEEEFFVFMNRIVYRVDEVEGKHVLVKESDHDKIMSVYTRYYMGTMSGEIPIDSTEYDEFGKDVYGVDRGDEYDFDDEEDDENEEADKDEADDITGDDMEDESGFSDGDVAFDMNSMMIFWSEESKTDILDVLSSGNPNFYIMLKNDDGERETYAQAAMFEIEGKKYALLIRMTGEEITDNALVAFRVDDADGDKKHVLVRVKDRFLTDRLIYEFRRKIAERNNKKGK